MDKLNRLYIFNAEIFDQEERFNEAYSLVDADRRQKIDRFKYPNGKNLSLGAGFLLHKALEDIGISDYKLEYRMRDKPYIAGRDDVFFNISHSGSMVALGLSDKEVGVDIEKDKHFKESLVNYVFTGEDLSLAKALTASCGLSEDQTFTRLWTAKESIMKYSGMVITLEPKKIRLVLGAVIDNSNPTLSFSCEVFDCRNLIISSYSIEDYQLSVCSEYEEFEVINV